MRTLSLLAVLLVLVASHPRNAADAHGHRHGHRFGKEKLTNVRFYLHDTLTGRDPTAVPVAHAAAVTPKPGDPTPFSSVYVVDDVLTEGPQRASRVVGSAQGLYASTGRHGLGLVLGIDFALNDYNGSSFVIFSRNPVADGDGRELAVVGGRGAFRMARGFALLRTHYLNTNNGDAIIEYNVTLLHY